MPQGFTFPTSGSPGANLLFLERSSTDIMRFHSCGSFPQYVAHVSPRRGQVGHSDGLFASMEKAGAMLFVSFAMQAVYVPGPRRHSHNHDALAGCVT
eukprot:3940973-Rhodomonas_salina.2